MVCVRGGEGGPLYSANRSVPTLNKYGNIVHRLGVDQIEFPAKDEAGWRQRGFGRPWGLADPRVPPLAPPFVLDTAWWASILCTSVPRPYTSVFSVKWALLVSVMHDEVFCVFLLRLMLAFSLFRVWVPANQESPKLVEMVSNKPYNYIWCLNVMKRCKS